MDCYVFKAWILFLQNYCITVLWTSNFEIQYRRYEQILLLQATAKIEVHHKSKSNIMLHVEQQCAVRSSPDPIAELAGCCCSGLLTREVLWESCGSVTVLPHLGTKIILLLCSLFPKITYYNFHFKWHKAWKKSWLLHLWLRYFILPKSYELVLRDLPDFILTFRQISHYKKDLDHFSEGWGVQNEMCTIEEIHF